MPTVNRLLSGLPHGTVDIARLMMGGPTGYGGRFGYAVPRAYNDASVAVVGATLATNTGSAAATGGGAFADTNIYTRLPRIVWPSSTSTANSAAGMRSSGLPHKYGLRVRFRWGCADAASIADARCFSGLTGGGDLGAAPSTAISDLTNIIGFGTDSGEADLSLFHNDGSGTATKTSLPGGAGAWPAHGVQNEVYEGLIEFPAIGVCNWSIRRLSTGIIAAGQITSNLPASTQSIAVGMHRASGATALAPSLGMFGIVYGDLRIYAG